MTATVLSLYFMSGTVLILIHMTSHLMLSPTVCNEGYHAPSLQMRKLNLQEILSRVKLPIAQLGFKLRPF